jgi:flagellar basal-body rod modification protein FlgD
MAVSSSNPLLAIPVYTNNGAPKVTQDTSTSSADQTQNFLKLLVAQIQNQDPMAPMDASTMTNQMSQLNMVSSIGTMNGSLTAMLAQMQSTNFINQATMIGRSPLIAGNAISYAGQGDVPLAANLTAPTSNLKASIIDNATGNEITSVDLGVANAGMKTFAWGGLDQSGKQVPAGSYSLMLTASDAAGNTISPTAYVGSPVASVAKGTGSEVNFTLQDGRTISASSINHWVS